MAQNLYNESALSPATLAKAIVELGRLTLGDKKVLAEESNEFRTELYNYMFEKGKEDLRNIVMNEVEDYLKMSVETLTDLN